MKRQWKTGLFLTIAVLATVIFGLLKTGLTATAANPTTMSFQGKVVNADGTNVTDGTYSFLFKLYSVSSAGSALWTETQSSVTVTAGVFQVNLGSSCSFFVANACNNNTPIDFNASSSLYLGITFNSDPAGEMNPRVQLQSVPFAYNSDKVGGFTAAQLVQLSPGSQQAGFINVSGAGTFGGNLVVTGTYNTNTFTGSTLTFGAAGTATIQAAVGQALNITGNAASTINTSAGDLTLQGGSGTVSIGTSTILTASGAVTLNAGGVAQNLTLNGSTTGLVLIGGTSTGDILIGGGTASTGCTITNSTGALSCSNALTISAGGANITGASTITGTLGSITTLTAATIDATTAYQAGGTAGLAAASCSSTQSLNNIKIQFGIVTGGTCANNLTDIAEQYNSYEQLQPGELVAPDTTFPYVKKTTSRYQKNALGIVSTAPNQVLGGDNPGYPIALIGRVPAKVNLENGPIQPGDYITASSTPGYGMKFSGSGQAVGIALEAYDGSQPELKIEVFVNPGYQQEAQTATTSDVVLTSSLTSGGALRIDSGSSGDVSIDSGTNSADVNIGTDKAAAVSISHSGATTNVAGALSVDESADFNGPVTMNFATTENLKVTKDLKIDNSSSTTADSAIEITNSGGGGYANIIKTPNFTVTGNGDLSAKNFTSKDGSFQLLDAAGTNVVTIDSTGNANFAGNLNLASASLSGGLNVGGDINVAGLSTFQKLATFIGKTVFRQDVEFDGHVTVAKDGAGYATLRATENMVHVNFVGTYANAPIVSAAVTNGKFAAYTVDNVTAGGFDIKTQVPALDNLTFSWTAIGVNSPQTASNPPPITP